MSSTQQAIGVGFAQFLLLPSGYYDQAGNKKFFGTAQKPGDLTKVVQNALDVWGGFDKLQVKTTPKELINFYFIK